MSVFIRARSGLSNIVVCVAVLAGLSACSSYATSDHSSLLTDSEWRLSSVVENDQPRALTDEDPVFSLQLRGDGSASGQVACNRWTGRHQVSNSEITISNASSTRARCHYRDDAMASLGNRYLDTLQATSRYQVTDDELVLNVAADQAWVFRPR